MPQQNGSSTPNHASKSARLNDLDDTRIRNIRPLIPPQVRHFFNLIIYLSTLIPPTLLGPLCLRSMLIESITVYRS